MIQELVMAGNKKTKVAKRVEALIYPDANMICIVRLADALLQLYSRTAFSRAYQSLPLRLRH